MLKLRFPEDLRVQTIVECLQSSTPVMIDIAQRPNVTEQEVMENNERYLYSVAQRTMSLPFGRFEKNSLQFEKENFSFIFLEVH